MKKCGVQKLSACDKWLSSLVPDIGGGRRFECPDRAPCVEGFYRSVTDI